MCTHAEALPGTDCTSCLQAIATTECLAGETWHVPAAEGCKGRASSSGEVLSKGCSCLPHSEELLKIPQIYESIYSKLIHSCILHMCTEEEKHEEEKQKRGGWERVAMALGRPFTKQSSAVCLLHLQVMLHENALGKHSWL